jgi:hypothetical protein
MPSTPEARAGGSQRDLQKFSDFRQRKPLELEQDEHASLIDGECVERAIERQAALFRLQQLLGVGRLDRVLFQLIARSARCGRPGTRMTGIFISR